MKPNRTRLKARLAVRHINSVKQGIRALVDVNQILDAWFNSHHPDAVQQTTMTGAQGREWARFHINIIDREKLNIALARLYADGWILGEDIATWDIARALKIVKAAPSKKQISRVKDMNWNTWKPGNRAAARLVEQPGALKRLLAGRGIKIQELSTTTLNRIGTALADGLNTGATRNSVADDISSILGDTSRALTIATTEMSSAFIQANMNLYQDSGVELIQWLVADPCDECQDNLDQSPIGINEEWRHGEPPVHPNCMCDIAPYVVDTGLWADVYGENIDRG